MPLRIGTLFAILVTSSIGVFTPIVLAKLPFKAATAVVSTVIKQFGTGIIIATAFIHVSIKNARVQKTGLTETPAVYSCLTDVRKRVYW